MAKKKYHDSGLMVKNDPSKVANMPTEIMLKQYPENPSYFPETYIDDSMHGSDKLGAKARSNPNYIKGMVE
jgi:hypothetical protein